MSDFKKHFFKVPKNINKMTDEQLSAFADEIFEEILLAFEKDKKGEEK